MAAWPHQVAGLGPGVRAVGDDERAGGSCVLTRWPDTGGAVLLILGARSRLASPSRGRPPRKAGPVRTASRTTLAALIIAPIWAPHDGWAPTCCDAADRVRRGPSRSAVSEMVRIGHVAVNLPEDPARSGVRANSGTRCWGGQGSWAWQDCAGEQGGPCPKPLPPVACRGPLADPAAVVHQRIGGMDDDVVAGCAQTYRGHSARQCARSGGGIEGPTSIRTSRRMAHAPCLKRRTKRTKTRCA